MKISEHRQRGFTLLEMLVVLLIAGMALALTSQALTQYQRANARVSASTQAGREYRMAERWFRDSVTGLFAVADPDAPTTDLQRINRTATTSNVPIFHGDAQGFDGTTLSPVLAGQGIPTRQHWEIARARSGNDALELEENGKQLTLRFPDAGELTLHYLDAKGGLHPQWPPAKGQWPQLPAAIALELGSGAVVAAAVLGSQDPRIVRYELEQY